MLDTLDAPPQKLPVTIVTGFLGSGKTTLLNHIIKNFEGYKVAVLVNEFGDINIDSQLLVKVGNDDDDKNMIELTNGCICCTINDDFADAVYRILIRRERVDYLIVETTGVANPLPIALTFLGTDLREFTHLDSIVTVVDAECFTPIEHYNSDVAIDQIFCGDIIVLNKNVFRAKGILWFDDSPLRHIFQLSGKRFTIDDSEWVTPQKNQMVLIGRKLDKLFLLQRLNDCLVRL